MSSRRSVWCGLLVTMALLGACSDDDEWRGLAGPPRDAGTGARDAAIAPSGLPCDVASIFSARCASCHGSTPIGGAPMALVSYENLTAPSLSVPAESMLARSIARMQDTVSPMPPGLTPSATAAEIATLQAWLDAGTPRSTCTNPTDPFGTPVMCTSGVYWTGGDDGSELMHPGTACMNCHARGEGPDFPMTIAATVYPSAHEPDDCNGSSESSTGSQITIEVRGRDGAVQMLSPDEAGNFFSYDAIALPITAIVHYQGRERAMVGEQPSADCNTCHTEAGTSSAPGRILLP
jgi:hypothetical protein